MRNNSTIQKRVQDLRTFCSSQGITLKEVTKKAGLIYNSVKVNASRGHVSESRMALLEQTAIDLAAEKSALRQAQMENLKKESA